MKNVLIVGGTAYSSIVISKLLEENDYNIHLMTYRQEQRKYGNYNWVKLNLEDENNVKDFINNLPKNFYSKNIKPFSGEGIELEGKIKEYWEKSNHIVAHNTTGLFTHFRLDR